MGTAKSFWAIGVREARVHAVIVCAMLWIVAGGGLLRPGTIGLFGRLKFPDFVHFYVLGDLAGAGRYDQLYDADAQYRRQVELVPSSAPDRFLPAYAPQTALIFLPFARLPYLPAACVWAALTGAAYAIAVWIVWRPLRSAIPDGWFVAAAAAGFPPFWSLILHGQTTLVPLAAFTLAWMALVRSRVFVAGLAFGLLAIKPQFGLALALVTLMCGEWTLLLGAIASTALQAGIVALVMGPDVLATYVDTLFRLPEMAPLLEPKPYQLHSIRALTAFVPGRLGDGVYVGGLLMVGWYAAQAWRARVPVDLRLAVVILASTLASPHLTVYDATVLALPLLWLSAWVRTNDPASLRAGFGVLVYGLYIFFLLPSALFVGVQMSVVIQCVIFWLTVRELRTSGSAHL